MNLENTYTETMKALLEAEHALFLQVMDPYFNVSNVPRARIDYRPMIYPAAIEFKGPNSVLYIREWFPPNNPESGLCTFMEALLGCAHESGHYLHFWRHPEFKGKNIGTKTHTIADVIAELAALLFIEETRGTEALLDVKKVDCCNSDSSLVNRVLDFYQKQEVDMKLFLSEITKSTPRKAMKTPELQRFF